MPLISIVQELKRAQQGRYALPLFDTFDMHGADGIITAFEEKRAPGIVGIYTSTLESPNARAFSAYIRAQAEDANVPISLMLDHGGSFEQCIKAISYGFTDVMYDGSRLPLEDNIENTRAVVRAAHAVGVGVEAELGHVGKGSEYQSFGAKRFGFTDPDSVEKFVAETGVDFLAVAVGTAHGIYDGEPRVDLDLLREIRARVDVPLVLHGGSGCPDDLFRSAISAGISKVNIATDLFMSASRGIAELISTGSDSYFAICRSAVEAFLKRCCHYIDVFGAANKA